MFYIGDIVIYVRCGVYVGGFMGCGCWYVFGFCIDWFVVGIGSFLCLYSSGFYGCWRFGKGFGGWDVIGMFVGGFFVYFDGDRCFLVSDEFVVNCFFRFYVVVGILVEVVCDKV